MFYKFMSTAISRPSQLVSISSQQVDENMKNCQKRNAVLEQKLWFRRDLFCRDSDKGDDASQMTVSEIINGKVRTQSRR